MAKKKEKPSWTEIMIAVSSLITAIATLIMAFN